MLLLSFIFSYKIKFAHVPSSMKRVFLLHLIKSSLNLKRFSFPQQFLSWKWKVLIMGKSYANRVEVLIEVMESSSGLYRKQFEITTPVLFLFLGYSKERDRTIIYFRIVDVICLNESSEWPKLKDLKIYLCPYLLYCQNHNVVK